tara:strand:+ start:1007 stop:1288 length:282 start_codon:yes stop_codon:yes gene_type:complete
MKIHVWVHKDDIINGEITKHYFQCPQIGYINYVQVEITQNEFTRLQDKGIQYSASIDGPGVLIDKKSDQEYSQDNWNLGNKRFKPNPNSLLNT